MMPEIVPPTPEPFPSMSDLLELPSVEDLMDEVWTSMQEAITPLILPLAVIGAVAIVFMFTFKKLLAYRAWKYMASVARPTVPRGVRWFLGTGTRIDERMEVSFKGIWATVRRPRTQAACWYISGGHKEEFESLLDVSKQGERFGEHLPAIAEKLDKTVDSDRVAMWCRVMEFAGHPAVHETLATPGYSMEVSLVAVEQNMPLEYAEALV